jgi:anti-sigma factor RsiW
MKAGFEIKLQAYLDGELSEGEAREVEASLANDVEGRSLLSELRNTNAALAVFEAEMRLPESREFYWSKIQREIQRQEKTEPARPVKVFFWQRFLVPAGAFAVLAIAALLAVTQPGSGVGSPLVETFLADSGAVTYRDDTEKTTVVWLSYPGENEFADADGEDTID